MSIKLYPGDYPTREQALATAFAGCEIGDEVVEHKPDCDPELDHEVGEHCPCGAILWRLSDTGWEAVSV
jgi:hypothetical protein